MVKQALAPLSAAVCIPIAAVVAWALDGSVALAIAGAALACAFASIEAGCAALGSRTSVQVAVALGVGGVVLRMAIVLGALFAIGLATTREQTLAAIVAFIGTFTVALAVRLVVAAQGAGGGAAGRASGSAAGTPGRGRGGSVRT